MQFNYKFRAIKSEQGFWVVASTFAEIKPLCAELNIKFNTGVRRLLERKIFICLYTTEGNKNCMKCKWFEWLLAGAQMKIRINLSSKYRALYYRTQDRTPPMNMQRPRATPAPPTKNCTSFLNMNYIRSFIVSTRLDYFTLLELFFLFLPAVPLLLYFYSLSQI